MPTTLATALASRGASWMAWIEISGYGRLLGGTSLERRGPWKLATLQPADHGWATADACAYQACLLSIEGSVGEEVNLRSGEVDLGELSFVLADLPLRLLAGEPAHGWDATDPILDYLMVQAPSTRWQLAANVTTAPAPETIEAWTLTSVAGLAVGQILYIGAEAVMVDALPGGAVANVRRAVQGTRSQPHATTTSTTLLPGDGWLYSRPQHLLGRYVDLWIGLFDTTAGTLLPPAQCLRVWRGQLSEYSQVDEGKWRLQCTPLLGRVDRNLGRRQFRGWARLPLALGVDEGTLSWQIDRLVGEPCTIDITSSVAAGVERGLSTYPDAGAGKHYFHARWGDQIVECYWTTSGPVALTAWGLLGTDATWTVRQQQTGEQFHDILLTSPAPGGTGLSYFRPVGGGDPFDHPIDIALALITSTGLGTNGNWDCLPAVWGAAVPIAELDLASWMQCRAAFPWARTAELTIGWDGKPFNLRRWLEQYVLGPCGWYMIQDEAGLLSLRQISEYYPLESWPAITEDDLIDQGADPPRIIGQLGETVSYQTLLLDWDRKSGKHLQTIQYRHCEAAERYEEAGAETEVDGRAYSPESIGGLLAGRTRINTRWFGVPRPRVRCSVGLHRIADTILDGVLLTCSTLANPDTGARGCTAVPALVLHRAVDLSRGVIDLELLLIGSPHVGRTPPAVRVTNSVRAGAGPYTWTVDCAATDYVGADSDPFVPARDVLALQVGDVLMGRSVRGQVLYANPFTVTAREPGGVLNRLTLTSAGGTLAVGSNLTFYRYSGAAAPSGAWTASMLTRGVAQANDTTGLLPDGSAPWVYGSP